MTEFLSRSSHIAYGFAAIMFLVGGLYGLARNSSRGRRDSGMRQDSIWPTWAEPLLYVVAGLAMLVFSAYKLRR